MENKINEINVKTQRLSHRKPPTQSLRYYVDVKTTRLGTSNKKTHYLKEQYIVLLINTQN